MGTAATTLVVALIAFAPTAHADPCTGRTPAGDGFATCFDPGNRLSITAGSDGFGGSIAIRHVVHFDDEPDLVWRLEHEVIDATHAAFEDRFSAAIYRGHYTRHARDGHIVLPLGVPKKIFLPFDIGAFTEVGTVQWRPGEMARLGLVKTAGLFDLARSRSFRKRFAFGPVARWEVEMTREGWTLGDHIVAPFSTAMANLHYESQTGRFVGDLRVEAGTAWHAGIGWEPEARAEATLERVMLAINDRPIAIVVGARYESETSEAIARIGARVVLFDRRDPRVSLHSEHGPDREPRRLIRRHEQAPEPVRAVPLPKVAPVEEPVVDPAADVAPEADAANPEANPDPEANPAAPAADDTAPVSDPTSE